jgi:dTDP-4-dehydrorhamnose 3,5-epimerase-like enzyme
MTRCVAVDLPVRRDERGALGFAQVGSQLPFPVVRMFHLFDLRGGVARGGHAHRRCHQFLVAMSVEFAVTTYDGRSKLEWRLDSPTRGLHVPPGHWVDLTPRADGAVLVVLASETYDEADYIRDRATFESHANPSAR